MKREFDREDGYEEDRVTRSINEQSTVRSRCQKALTIYSSNI